MEQDDEINHACDICGAPIQFQKDDLCAECRAEERALEAELEERT